jgi:hypothetical protein
MTDQQQMELTFPTGYEDMEELFPGPVEPELDNVRLAGQAKRIWQCMVDGKWRTLREIEAITGDTTASVSAQLRNFRNLKHLGGHTVNVRRREGREKDGVWEYQLIPNPQIKINFKEA